MKRTTLKLPPYKHKALLLILLSGLLLAIYHVFTAVMISRDGVYYIQRSQELSGRSIIQILGTEYFGFPLLILLARNLIYGLIVCDRVFEWIYAGQIVSILCRILAFLPLYWMGRKLAGFRHGTVGCLLVLILPHPARYGADVLREWPHFLFLATGLWLVVRGSQRFDWRLFLMAGLTAGMGFFIRSMCLQVVAIGFGVLVARFLTHTCPTDRKRVFLSMLALSLGFLALVTPQRVATGRVLPRQIRNILEVAQFDQHESTPYVQVLHSIPVGCRSPLLSKWLQAPWEVVQESGEMLMWWFLPVWLWGLYLYLRRPQTQPDRVFLLLFLGVNLLFILARYFGLQPHHVSRRYLLPLVCVTAFAISIGLEDFAERLSPWFRLRSFSPGRLSPVGIWYVILLSIGILICLPKLLRPLEDSKRGYRDAAVWLQEHTEQQEYVVVPDRRIGFYANRKALLPQELDPPPARFFVRIESQDETETDRLAGGTERARFAVNSAKPGKDLVIYEFEWQLPPFFPEDNGDGPEENEDIQ